MNTHKRTVPPWFRELCKDQFPALEENYGLWRLLEFLAFSVPRNDEIGLLISTQFLAHLENKEKYHKNHRYTGHNLLTAFSEKIAKLEIKSWSIGEECRRVISVDWPPEFKWAIDDVLKSRLKSDRVYLCNGQPYTYKRHKIMIESNRARAIEESENAGFVEAKNLLMLLNGLPPNRFTMMLKYWDEAMERAKIMDAEMTARNPQLENYNAKILQEIHDYAQPFYHPVSRSSRVFAAGNTIQNLNTDLRKILCRDWYECDLSSAHLAICGKLWDVPLVQSFLKSGCSIWKTLADDYDLPLTPERKAVLKKALYSLVYGDSKRNITIWLRKNGLSESVFYSHPVIDSLFAARQKIMAKIKHENGGRDCWGRWIDTVEIVRAKIHENGIEKEVSESKLNVKSILAQLSQSMEFKLLYPAVEMAIQQSGNDEGFAIMLWQYDGFSIACKQSQIKYWQKAISDSIDSNADSLDILSKLVWKNP